MNLREVPESSQPARRVADQANTKLLRFTKTQEPQFQGQGVKPATFEEFINGVPLSPTGKSTARQFQAIPVVTSNPLKTVTAPSLVTTCEVPTPVPQDSQAFPQEIGFTQEGPYIPRLVPHVPMFTTFKHVVSYRQYRLKDRRA